MTAATVRLERASPRLLAEHQWALVDPLLTPDALQQLEGAPAAALIPPGFAGEGATLPLLCPLNAASLAQQQRWAEWLEEAQRSGSSPLFATLLRTEADALSLRGHLQHHLLVTSPAREKHWLRWHDARVLAHLLWVFTPAQLAQLLGPVQTWTFPLEGEWWSLHHSAPAATDPLSLLRFKPVQFAHLEDIELINQVMDTAGLSLRHAAGHGPRIATALHEARERYGQTDDSDLADFALQAHRASANPAEAARHHAALQALKANPRWGYQRAWATTSTPTPRP